MRLTAKKSGFACTKSLTSLFHVPNVIGVNLVNGALEGQTPTAFLLVLERHKENQSLLMLYSFGTIHNSLGIKQY